MEQYNVNGIGFSIHVSSMQTEGRYSLIEVIFPSNEEGGISSQT